MLFPYGWPARLTAPGPPGEPYIYLHADQEYVIAVTAAAVQVWSGGAQRVRLGEVTLSQEDADSFGTHAAAVWSPERGRLAVLVSCELHMQPAGACTWPSSPLSASAPRHRRAASL